VRKPWGTATPDAADLPDDPDGAEGADSAAAEGTRRAVGDALVRLVGRGEVHRTEDAERGPAAGEEDGDSAATGSRADDADAADGLRNLVLTVGRAARDVGAKALAGGRWITDTLVDVAPRLPVRSAERLREHHPGRTTDQIAYELVSAAVKASTAVGVAGGALAAFQFAAPPTLLAAPAQLAAETLAVAAIEIKLVAELHELYGLRAEGSSGDRGLAYLMAWTNQKGIDPLNPKSVVAGLGAAAKRQVRRRVVGRFGRNVFTLGPMLTGAVIGGAMNRHETKDLGQKILMDLRVATAGRRAR
jgi:hypothetical protein